MISLTGLLAAVSLALPSNASTGILAPEASMEPICWHVGTYYDEDHNGWEITRCVFDDGTIITWYNRKPTTRM